MEWGAMYHSFVLTPDEFGRTYAVLPDGIDRRTREGREEWEAWQAQNADKQPVAEPTMVELVAMREALMGHGLASAALSEGEPELSCFGTLHGVECKCRFDWLRSGDTMVDLKTTTDARPDAFSRAAWNFRYHVQAAFYSDVYYAATGRRIERVLFIAQERAQPYAVNIYVADEEMIEQGRREYIDDLSLYKQCLEADEWPAYPEVVQALVLPVWAQDNRGL